VSSFLRSNTSNNAPSANFVSAKNLLHPCPPSLLKALHPSNPDRDIWLKSYDEEKWGLNKLDVYQTINKKTYLQLKRSGKIGKAPPSMCVLVIKPDEDGNPHRAKSRIVVLGNHEDHSSLEMSAKCRRDMSCVGTCLPKTPCRLVYGNIFGTQDCQSRVWPCRVTSHSQYHDCTR
jgi:hypothetical protein